MGDFTSEKEQKLLESEAEASYDTVLSGLNVESTYPSAIPADTAAFM